MIQLENLNLEIKLYEALSKNEYHKAGPLLNQLAPRKETTAVIVQEMTTVSLSDDQKTKPAPDKLQRVSNKVANFLVISINYHNPEIRF